ncbi:MAG TPA: biotin carboxylase, partial [Candidatus Bipolaricaulota bacterium]
FMPSVGRIERVRFPHGPGVRNDGGIYRGYEVPVYYDSLLSKLVVLGRDREQARRRMLTALRRLDIQGIATTKSLCQEIINHQAFAQHALTTDFIESLLS